MPRILSRLFPISVLGAFLLVVFCVSPAKGQNAGTAATPTFSSPAGVYAAAQSVTISDTTPGAVIHYTLNWATPNANSPVYSGAITISQNTTVKAIAVAAGYTTSPVASAIYTIRTAEPAYSPAPGVYSAAQAVTLSDTTPGAKIYYTLDNTWPTTGSTLYTGPITVSKNTIVRAAAFATGYGAALSTLETYYIRAATPTVNPPPGTYKGAQSVVISDTTPGAVVYYTLDNSQPTSNSAVYSGPISINNNTIVHAAAFAPGYVPSLPTSALQYMLPSVARATPPSFSVPAGAYSSAQTVALSDSTPGATIYYTTDGSTPYPWSTRYTGPITLSQDTNLQAIARADGYNSSTVASASYQFLGLDPVFSPGSGGYLQTQKPTITDATPGATIYYTTDGSTPTATHGTIIRSGGSIVVAANQTVKAVAVVPGWSTGSNVSTATYVIDPSSIMPHEWTLMNDGVGDSGPGALTAPPSWTDSLGNFWLFGGYPPDQIYPNDMWQFKPDTNEWTKVIRGGAPHYGTLGVPDGANLPEPRSDTFNWTDKNGNFWMFGGCGQTWVYNDLWKFDPNAANSVTGTNGVWTWMGGSQLRNQPGVYGKKGVLNSQNMPGSHCDGTAWADANGNFWFFGGYVGDYSYYPFNYYRNDLWEFLPNIANSVTHINGVWVWMGGSSIPASDPPVYNTQGVADGSSYPGGRQSADGWTDAGGNLWLFGGGGSGYPNDLWEFDPNAANSITGIKGVWTWISGNDQAETATNPGNTNGMGQWKDFSGNFWELEVLWTADYNFAGMELWTYNPTAKEWTREGRWDYQTSPATKFAPSPVIVPSLSYIPATWTDTDGYLWYFSGSGSMWLFDPDPPVPRPVITPSTGSYTAPQTVTISDSDNGATIYYTTDGTTPTTSSSVYHGPILVSANRIVVALAVKGRAYSNLAAATYSF